MVLDEPSSNLDMAAIDDLRQVLSLWKKPVSYTHLVKALSAPMLFDYMAIVMGKQALADRDFTMNVILPDVGEQHMLRVKNGVLLVYADTLSDDADRCV